MKSQIKQICLDLVRQEIKTPAQGTASSRTTILISFFDQLERAVILTTTRVLQKVTVS